MILAAQALVEYIGVSGSQLAHAIGLQAARASRFVADNTALTIVAVVAVLLLFVGKRRRT
jgi:plasmid maintenance system antidote protein VapI